MGFELNSQNRGFKSIENDKNITHFGLNLFFSVGHYDVITTPLEVKNWTNAFKLTGHGAEGIKGKWGAQSIPNRWQKMKRDSFWKEIKLGMDSIGVDFDDPVGAEFHYLAFRNSLHPGRNNISSMCLSPLLNKNLTSLAFSEKNIHPLVEKISKKNNQMTIIKDLIIAQGLKFTSAPFYNEPSFSEEQIML